MPYWILADKDLNSLQRATKITSDTAQQAIVNDELCMA